MARGTGSAPARGGAPTTRFGARVAVLCGLAVPALAQIPPEPLVGPDWPAANGIGTPSEGLIPARNAQSLQLDDDLWVHLATGEVVLSTVDLSIPSRGFDLQLRRIHRSQISYGGPFGWNTGHNFDEKIDSPASGVIRHLDGGRLQVDLYAQQSALYECTTPGVYRKARWDGAELLIRDRDGMIRRFFALTGAPNAGRLKEVSDRFGNKVTCEYDAQGRLSIVRDTVGRPVTLAYDSVGRIETVTDFAGRVTTYGYLGGDLETVTYPPITGMPAGPSGANDFPAGTTVHYEYTASSVPLERHGIESVTYPREVASSGPAAVALVYDADRVQSATVGAGTYGFDYQSPGGGAGEASTTIVVDRKGFVRHHGFNAAGHLLREEVLTQGIHPNDPASFATLYTPNAHGERTLVVRPAGDRLESVFDTANADLFQRGNETSRREVPAPGAPGNAQPFRWDYRFDPLYVQWTVTTQSGDGKVFDYQEGNPASTSLSQYASNWQISLSGIAFSLGDQNGDGVTSQIGGNVVREESRMVSLGQTQQYRVIKIYTFDAFGRPLTASTGEGALTVYAYAAETAGGLLASITEDADPALSPPTAGSSFWTKPVDVLHARAVTKYTRDAVGNITARTDPRGVKTTYVVNQHNRIVLETRGAALDPQADPTLVAAAQQGWSRLATPAYRTYYSYDANGNLVREDKANVGSGAIGDGWVTTQSVYDVENRLTSRAVDISDTETALTQFAYDPSGNVSRRTQPQGNYDEWTRDERDLLFTEVRGASHRPTASTWTYSYDPNGRRTSTTGPADLDGDGLEEKTLFVYDGRGRLIETIEPVGTVHKAVFDAADRDVGQEIWGQAQGPSPMNNQTTGNVLLSQVTRVRDELGREIEVKERVFVPGGLGASLPYAAPDYWVSRKARWDRDDKAVEKTDQNGDVSVFAYDGLGRLIHSQDAEGNESDQVFDATSNLVAQLVLEVNPLQPAQAESKAYYSVYDALGRRVRQTDILGRTEYFAYDSLSRRVAEADAKGPVTTDPLNLVAGGINLPGNTRRWIHDGLGRPVQTYADTYPNGQGLGASLFASSFDPAIDPTGISGKLASSYDYDRNGNVLSVTTDSSSVLAMQYDAQDRLKRKTFPDGSYFVTTYWRDGSVASHMLTTSSGARFRTLLMEYDGSSRLVEELVDLPTGSAIEGTLARTFQYNGLGFITHSSDDNGPNGLDSVVSRVLDSDGMLLQEVQNGHVVSRQLDSAGNRTALWYPNGRRVDFLHDTRYRLEAIRESNGAPIADYEYFGLSRVAKITFGNGLQHSFATPVPGSPDVTGYDASGFPLRLEHRNGATNLTVLTNVVDRAGNRAEERRKIGAAAVKADVMAYDSQGRLATFERNKRGTNPAELTQTYQYDGDSVWEQLIVQAANQVASLYSFTSGPDWAYDSIASAPLVHDQAGNRTGDTWFHYRYDAFDRLVRVAQSLPGGAEGITVLAFAYDAQGRRIAKASSTSSVRYSYEVDHLVEERTAAGQVVAQHVFGNRVDEVAQSKRVVDASGQLQTFYLLANTLGSTSALSNASGAIVERYEYDAFGAPRFQDSAGAIVPGRVKSAYGNCLLFTGREYDSELAEFKVLMGLVYGYVAEWPLPLGQYFYRARYMDPAEGRFTSRDPLALANNDTSDPVPLLLLRLNQGFVEGPYAYVANAPTNATDPFGLQGCAVTFGSTSIAPGTDPGRNFFGPDPQPPTTSQPTPRPTETPSGTPKGGGTGGAGGAKGTGAKIRGGAVGLVAGEAALSLVHVGLKGREASEDECWIFSESANGWAAMIASAYAWWNWDTDVCVSTMQAELEGECQMFPSAPTAPNPPEPPTVPGPSTGDGRGPYGPPAPPEVSIAVGASGGRLDLRSIQKACCPTTDPPPSTPGSGGGTTPTGPSTSPGYSYRQEWSKGGTWTYQVSCVRSDAACEGKKEQQVPYEPADPEPKGSWLIQGASDVRVAGLSVEATSSGTDIRWSVTAGRAGTFTIRRFDPRIAGEGDVIASGELALGSVQRVEDRSPVPDGRYVLTFSDEFGGAVSFGPLAPGVERATSVARATDVEAPRSSRRWGLPLAALLAAFLGTGMVAAGLVTPRSPGKRA